METSKITAWVGIFSLIPVSRTVSLLSPARSAKRFDAGIPASTRFSIARPSILAKLDLPDPKKPETQTPTPSCGLFGVSA